MTGNEAIEQALREAKSDIDSAVDLLDNAHQLLHVLSLIVEKPAPGDMVPVDLDHEPQTASSD